MGSEELHSYHRHALVSKLPEHYRRFGWSEDGSAYNGSYLWPIPTGDDNDDENGWILRWPKSMKLPPVPISMNTDAPSKTRTTPAQAGPKRRRNNSAPSTQRRIEKKQRITQLRSGKKQKTMQLRSGRRL